MMSSPFLNHSRLFETVLNAGTAELTLADDGSLFVLFTHITREKLQEPLTLS